jgi:hypothetical protein
MELTVCQAPMRYARQYRATSGEIQGTNIAQIAAEIESGRKQSWMIAWRQIGSNA